MKKFSRIIIVSLFAAILSACASTKMAVNPSFWNQKEARVGVAIASYPETAAHKGGAQGLLDMAINNALASDLQTHLKTLTADEFDTVRDQFVTEFQARGFRAKVVPAPINLEAYEKFTKPTGSSDAFFHKDLKPLSTQESVDFLVLLSIERFGTLRNYYGFVPTGAPQGLLQSSGRLIDLRNNQVMWFTIAEEHESVVSVEGPWDQVPDYPNLTAAIKKSIPNAQRFLLKDFLDEPKEARKM